MTDKFVSIKAHEFDNKYGFGEPTWRPSSRMGDAHRYTGTGTTGPGTKKMKWSKCGKCGKAKNNRIHGEAFRQCSYCGSIHLEDLLEGLPEPKQFDYSDSSILTADSLGNWEYADWKYGYPHKLYVTMPNGDHLKFYTRHLIDFPELVDQFNIQFSSTVWFELVADPKHPGRRTIKWSTGDKPGRLLAPR